MIPARRSQTLPAGSFSVASWEGLWPYVNGGSAASCFLFFPMVFNFKLITGASAVPWAICQSFPQHLNSFYSQWSFPSLSSYTSLPLPLPSLFLLSLQHTTVRSTSPHRVPRWPWPSAWTCTDDSASLRIWTSFPNEGIICFLACSLVYKICQEN